MSSIVFRFLSLLLLFSTGMIALTAAEVEDWKGTVFSGELRLDNGKFVVKTKDGDKAIAPADFFSARYPGDAGAVSGALAVYIFTDGSRLSAKLPSGNLRDTYKIARSSGKQFEFAANKLQALEINPLLDAVQPEASPNEPHVMMRNGKVMACELEWFTAIEAGIKNASGRMRLRIDQIHRVVFSPVAPVTYPATAFCVQAESGDTVYGNITQLNNERIIVKNAIGDWEFPVTSLRSIDSCSSRAVSLLTLKPEKITKIPFIDFVREPRFDSSLTGRALKIGNRIFAHGVSMHSHTEISYNLDSKFQRFVAEIGLDASLSNQGDAVFVVRSGSEKLGEYTAVGDGKTQYVSIPVAGVKTMRLIVDFGKNGSSGDHAIWGNPRLIK